MTHSSSIRSPLRVTCAAAILFASFAGAAAKDPSSDLDTLLLGALEKSGTGGGSAPVPDAQTKYSKRKTVAAEPTHVVPASPAPRQETASASAVPTAEAVAPSDGLLAAIGIAVPTSSGPRVTTARPLPAERGGLLAALGTITTAEPVATAVGAGVPPAASSTVAMVSAPPRVAAVSVSSKERRPAVAPAALSEQSASPETTGSIRMGANAQMPISYSPALVQEPDYRVDAGDKLRIVVYGQEGLTNTYAIDAGGGITMPLIGRVIARGMTPAGLAAHVTTRLRNGYIREPSVAVEVEAYRPFFILGEVAAPGQYPYVPNMSVEAAVAIAGGFSPRARRDNVTLTHRADGGQSRAAVPLGTPLSPGDTITVGERWF